MTSFNGNSFQIFAPNVASEFEDLCVTIFRCVWNDKSAVKHGRSGQSQNGVDIYGKDSGDGLLIGVQCKKKDLTLNKHLTEREILEEVKLAEGFEPSLSKLIIATTDASDVNLQKYVRKLSKEYEKKGLFSIVLHSWDDLKTWIGQYWDIVSPIHYPTFIQSESEGVKTDDPEKQIKEIDSESLRTKSTKNDDIDAVSTVAKVIQPDNITNELMIDEFNREIDHSRDLIQANRYTDALAYLLDLKDRIWSKSNDYLKFRLLTNIASCQAHLEDLNEAASNFFKAYEYNPKDEKAQSNRAYAFLLAGEYQQAVDASRAIIKTNPMHATAYGMLVQALGYLGEDFKVITDNVPKKLQENPEILYALANTAKKLGLHEVSTGYLAKVVKQDKEDPETLAYYAANIIEEVISANKLSIRGYLAPEYRERLEEALTMLKKAWGLIPNNEDRRHFSFILHNIATAYRLRGELEEAQASLEELLILAPNDRNYKILAASIAYDRKDYERVKQLMSDLATGDDAEPEAKVRLAEVCARLGDNERAIEILREFIDEYTEQDQLWEDAYYHLFDVYVEQALLEDADTLITDFETKKASSIIIGFMKAKLERIRGNTSDALILLHQAFKQIDLSNPTEWLIEIAQEAYECKDYVLASKSYAAVIDPRTDTILTRKYLHSLYESKKYQKVIEIAEELRKTHGTIRDITQFEWAAYQELQDLPHAKDVLNEYISQNEKDADARLRLALLDFRSNELTAVDDYLAGNINVSDLDTFSAIQLANLYQLRNKTERTLDILYELRRLKPSDADAHSAYISIFLGLEETHTSDRFTPNETGPDTVIFYNGGHILIEDQYEPNVQHDEISLAEADELGYLGKKVGETIILSENSLSGPVEAKITKIQSKYVFAFQETLKTYERRFRNRNDIMGIKMDPNDITPILKHLDQSHEHTESVEKLYSEGKVTVDIFGKLLGKGYFDVFYGLRSLPDIGIRVAIGTTEEREDALQYLASEPTVVADISALVTLYELGYTTHQLGIELKITQSVRDLVKQEIAKVDGIGRRKSMTLYKSRGTYFRQEISAEDTQKWIDRLRGLEEWIENNAEVEPIIQEQLDAFNSSQDKLGDVLENTQVDTLVLAEGEGRILLADDVTLRILAKETLSIDSVWTQVLIQYLADEGNIDSSEYTRTSIELACSNYHHISINPAILMEAAQQSKWLPEEPFTATLKAITRKETTLQSLVVVLINFMYEFYKKPILVDKSFIIQQILNEVHKNHNVRLFIDSLDKVIDLRFYLLPNYASELKEVINNWAELHDV